MSWQFGAESPALIDAVCVPAPVILPINGLLRTMVTAVRDASGSCLVASKRRQATHTDATPSGSDDSIADHFCSDDGGSDDVRAFGGTYDFPHGTPALAPIALSRQIHDKSNSFE